MRWYIKSCWKAGGEQWRNVGIRKEKKKRGKIVKIWMHAKHIFSSEQSCSPAELNVTPHRHLRKQHLFFPMPVVWSSCKSKGWAWEGGFSIADLCSEFYVNAGEDGIFQTPHRLLTPLTNDSFSFFFPTSNTLSLQAKAGITTPLGFTK